MPINYDGNDKYTPPIPTHGGLKMCLHLKPQVSSFSFSFSSLLTNFFTIRLHSCKLLRWQWWTGNMDKAISTRMMNSHHWHHTNDMQGFFIFFLILFFSYFLYRFTLTHPTTNTTTLGTPKVTSNATKWQQQQRQWQQQEWQQQQQQGPKTQMCLKAGMYLFHISFILLIFNVTDYHLHVP